MRTRVFGSRQARAAVASVAAALAFPAAAQAVNAPRLLAVGHVKQHPEARWELPASVEATAIEIATSPAQASSGRFFSENVVVSDALDESQTHWLYERQLRPGTYYVHVEGWDDTCLRPPYEGECGTAWSNVLPLVIEKPPPAPEVMRLGRGIGRWRIGMRFRLDEGLIRTRRFPRNGGPGCLLGAWNATRVDYYPGRRVAWLNGSLFDVATTRRGDRADDGFAIGAARLAAVRRRYPKARVARTIYGGFVYPRPPTGFNLGYRVLVRSKRTGYESWAQTLYWFDRAGLLVALETNVGGC